MHLILKKFIVLTLSGASEAKDKVLFLFEQLVIKGPGSNLY